MIGSIVASTILSKPTMLQIDLRLEARRMDIIKYLYDYGVCSTYQETLLFKVPAAVKDRKSGTGFESRKWFNTSCIRQLQC